MKFKSVACLKFYWDMATVICLPTVCICFCSTIRELSRCNKYGIAYEAYNIY